MPMIANEFKIDQFTFQTEATPTDKDWYEWKVRLAGPAAQLKEVEAVEYILHPTFPDRIRRMRNRNKQFELVEVGWGDFDIHVNVYLKNGDEVSGVVPLELK